MKKTPQKLVLRSETLRTLRTLANKDLARAVGGFDSGAEQCPAVFDTGHVACSTDAAVIATAACR